MSLTNDMSVSAAVAATQSSTAGDLQMMVLNKALNSQAAAAVTLIDAVPKPPTLATEGTLGTRLNTYA
ncbi:putative motility protein [Aquabacterium sp.]|uniref:putative motility protein n=1 Tax=Aquabacterium sp. TaxID=1872578 RepID=UPI0035AEB731